MEKEESEKAAALAAANSSADAPADAPSVDVSGNDEMSEELVTTARRRLMDWMVINNSPVQMGRMLGLAKHSVDKLEDINPRLLASKLAYAVFPEAPELVGLSTTDKQKAAKPETLWTGSEIDLLVGSDSVTVKVAVPADEAADKDKAVEKADAVDVLPAETDAAQAPAPEAEEVPLP